MKEKIMRIYENFPVLDDSRKEKLIQILLFIGSIMIAFREISEKLKWVFILFLLTSIAYFIFLKKPNFKKGFVKFLLSLSISFSFISVVTYNLGYSLITLYPNFSEINLTVTAIYYLVFGCIVTFALYKSE